MRAARSFVPCCRRTIPSWCGEHLAVRGVRSAVPMAIRYPSMAPQWTVVWVAEGMSDIDDLIESLRQRCQCCERDFYDIKPKIYCSHRCANRRYVGAEPLGDPIDPYTLVRHCAYEHCQRAFFNPINLSALFCTRRCQNAARRRWLNADCCAEKCFEPVVSRGWCERHYVDR